MGDLFEEMGERGNSALGLLPVEEFVGRVVAVFGQRQAEKDNRCAEHALHAWHGADRSAFAGEDDVRGEAESVGSADRVRERAAGIPIVWLQPGFGVDPVESRL
jgi:hypothetical protein